MSKLFEIPLTDETAFDVTPFIVLNTYNVSKQPVFDEWTDGAGHTRRAIKRRRLEGTFSVKFFNAKDYQDFLSAIETHRVEGYDYVRVHAYDNKSRTLITGLVVDPLCMYIDYELPNVEPSVGFSFNEEIEITVTEK